MSHRELRCIIVPTSVATTYTCFLPTRLAWHDKVNIGIKKRKTGKTNQQINHSILQAQQKILLYRQSHWCGH